MPWFGKAQKTMKPHKVGNKKMQELLTRNFPTLGTDPHEAVKLPDGTDLNWWIAANSIVE